MILSLDKARLVDYVRRQLDVFFPDGESSQAIEGHIDEALDRVEKCFSSIYIRYFWADSQTVLFNHLNSDQYSMFLYVLSNTVFRNQGPTRLCEKAFCLNKMMHGIDVYYEVELPEIFCFHHAVGTVLGRARYSDYLLVYHNCTIGAARELGAGKNEYPILGKYLAAYKGAAILGKSRIADNCKIAAHSLILDQDLVANRIYIGVPRDHITKENLGHDPIWTPGHC